MTTEIVYITHSTSADNEAGVASGWLDTPLTSTGEAQAVEVGERYRDEPLDAVYASDLTRARRTAEIAFGARGLPVSFDARLRECDYGALAGARRGDIEGQRLARVEVPHPGGESYRQAVERHGAALDEIAQAHQGGRVLIVGHYATWMALEHFADGRPLDQLATEQRDWQPGWRYTYEGAHAGLR
jgi:2,3-bisphosphoglycerate-dependent phosphoglycerate mutase